MVDLLGDFDAYRSAGLGTEYMDDDIVIVEPVTSTSGFDAVPLLSVDTTIRQAARGRGEVVCVACSNDNVIVATSRGFLLRYHWDEYGNEKVAEVEITKQVDSRIQKVFADPTGHHVLVSLKTPAGMELHYVHKRWPKAKAVSKLKGVNITAVGWCTPASAVAAAEGGASGSTSGDLDVGETSTGNIVLGSDTGGLHELVLEERWLKKEPLPKQLLDFKDRRRAICSLHKEGCSTSSPGSGRMVLVATPSQLYVFQGGPTLEALFAAQTAAPPRPVLEAVSPSMHSQLHLYSPAPDGSSSPQRFAWLVGSVVYHGELHTDSSTTSAVAASGDGADVLQNVVSLPLALGGGGLHEGSGGGAADDEPRSMVLTEFHFIVLAQDRLLAVNRVSGKVVQAIACKSPLTRNVSGEPSREIDGLLKDPVTGTIYMHSDEGLYEVTVRHEARDMWAVYLELQDWDAALRLCSNNTQRDDVHRAWAEAAMAEGDPRTAALHFAKILGGRPAFEDVALSLVESANGDALQLFLSTKLQVLGRGDKAQATMVAAWLTELQLDQINRALLEAGGQPDDKYLRHEASLRAFLTEYVEVLDPNTTLTLLSTYGRLDDLMHYASCRGDHEGLLEHLMMRPGGATRALAVLRKPSVSQELVYKFAPGLVAASAEEAAEFFIAARPALDPRRLIPALLRFGEPGAPRDSRRHVLRYVEYAVDVLSCRDGAVHNFAVALHSLSEGEAGLLGYLGRGRDPAGRPLYDPKYALRLATERGRPRACVKLLCELGMYPDAVRRALILDLDLAKAVANAPDDDDALRRKLWLEVARHVVQSGGTGSGTAGGTAGGTHSTAQDDGGKDVEARGGSVDQTANIKKAVEFLKEAGGLLRIEDILPFFPDFVTIDNFKDAICESLGRYNAAIEGLKGEMEEATEIAEAVRRDIKMLGCRTATVSTSSPCTRCGRPISEPPPPSTTPSGGAIPQFYVFPSGLLYHGACCAAETAALVAPQQRAKIAALLAKLAKSRQPPLVAAKSSLHASSAKQNGGGVAGPAGTAGGSSHHPTADEAVMALQAQLMEEVAAEDPRNGEVVVRLLDMPFVVDADRAELDSWQL